MVRPSGPPRRANPRTGPSAWPRNTPPMGRPPNGHRIRAASARVRAAGNAIIRATTGPDGTTRQATATKAASTAISTSAPGRVKERAQKSPGTYSPNPATQPAHNRVRGRRPPRRHQSSPAAGKASTHQPHGGRERARPTPEATAGMTTRPGRGVTRPPDAVMVIRDGRHRGVSGRSSVVVEGTGETGAFMAPAESQRTACRRAMLRPARSAPGGQPNGRSRCRPGCPRPGGRRRPRPARPSRPGPPRCGPP